MESGETYEGQGYSGPETPKSNAGPLPNLYFNTAEIPAPGTPSSGTYPPFQKSPGMNQGPRAPSPVQPPYNDPYRYPRHIPSPSAGRVMPRPPGGYQGPAPWPNPNSPAPPHMSYMAADRSRYIHPPYSNYDPSKPYPGPPQPGPPTQSSVNQPGWGNPANSPNQPPYTSTVGPPVRHPQADIVGPVVPAGLQALQANNNNAALMQHQHTPMRVPNPHYNQSLVHPQQAGHLGAPPRSLEGPTDIHHRAIQRPGQEMMALERSQPPNTPQTPYYPGHMPPSNVGPMHHQMNVHSPSMSPYPASVTTPSSTKSKTRGNKSYQCPKCVKVFRRGDHLKRHLLSVHDHEHPYQCGECGKGFASVPTLLKHAKSLHLGSLTKGLMCLRCQMTFTTIPELEAHATSLHVQEDDLYMQTINTSSKQHLCTTCSKSFSSAANLKRHMQLLHRTKEEGKLFCRECGKGFSRTENLRKHVEKAHFGNPNAMPDLDERDNESDNLSQTPSSESESRGPSIDTDESSMSGPPSINTPRYPPVPPIYPQQAPNTNQMYPPVPNNQPQNPPMTLPYQSQYPKPPHQPMPHPPIPQNIQQPPMGLGEVTQVPTAPSTPGSSANLNAKSDVPVNSTPPSMPGVSPSGPAQYPPTRPPVSMPPASVQSPGPGSASPVVMNKAMAASDLPPPANLNDPINRAPRIEPKTVSEALSMAMKALSEFDDETPGFEAYPTSYQSQMVPAGPPNNHFNQNYSYYPMMENGALRALNSPRPPDSGSGVPQTYNQSTLQRQSGNFLMTMPPPPGSMTVGRHLSQPPMAGGQVAPHLSRLLQGGGGGVEVPNGINNCNTQRQSGVENGKEEVKKRSRRSRKKDKSGGFGGGDGIIMLGERSNVWKEDNLDSPSSFNCSVCGVMYESIDQLMVHIEGVHLKKNPHECCICNKKFAQAGNVKRHIRFVHLRERPFRCKDCSSTFDRLCYLQRHMRSHLRPDDSNPDVNHLKPCCCPECGKKCLTAHHLRGHMQRKHFAKNKQNYGQFLMKYRHLEAIGAGPGAITNPNKAKKGGRKRKKSKQHPTGNDVSGYQAEKLVAASGVSSSKPFSSIQTNSLSNYPQQGGNVPAHNMNHQPMATQSNFAQQSFGLSQYQGQMHLTMTYDSNHGNGAYVGTAVPGLTRSSTTISDVRYGPESVMMDALGNTRPQDSTSAFSGVNFDVANFLESQVPIRSKQSSVIRQRKRKTLKSKKKRLPYRCTHCVHRSFARLEMLKSHLSLCHGTALKRHVCLPCGMSYSSSSRLRSHMYRAHKEKRLRGRKRKVPTPIFMESPPLTQATINYQAYTQPAQSCYPIYGESQMTNAPNMAPYISSHHPLYGYSASAKGIMSPSTVQVGYGPGNVQHNLANSLPMVQT